MVSEENGLFLVSPPLEPMAARPIGDDRPGEEVIGLEPNIAPRFRPPHTHLIVVGLQITVVCALQTEASREYGT